MVRQWYVVLNHKSIYTWHN